MLTQDDTGDSVTVQQLGGLSSAAGRLSTTVSIVGTSKLEDLRALLQNGSIAEVSGTVWHGGTRRHGGRAVRAALTPPQGRSAAAPAGSRSRAPAGDRAAGILRG